MDRKRLASMFAIAACGLLLTGGGVAAATDAPATGAPAARGTTTAPAGGGHVFFTAYQNDDLPGATVVLYLRTCSGHVAVTGAAPVVAGSGTGAYKGIRGNFKLTITGNEVDAKPGCHPFSGSVLLAQSIFIAGSGTVSSG